MPLPSLEHKTLEWTLLTLEARRLTKQTNVGGDIVRPGDLVFIVRYKENRTSPRTGLATIALFPSAYKHYSLYFSTPADVRDSEVIRGNIPMMNDSPVPGGLYIESGYIYLPKERGIFDLNAVHFELNPTLAIIEQF